MNRQQSAVSRIFRPLMQHWKFAFVTTFVLCTALILPAQNAVAQTKAGPVTGLTASPAAGGGVTLTWFAPGNAGSAPITGYQIQRALGGGNFAPVTNAHTGTATTYTDSGLTAGTEYRYQIAAINSLGTGDYSAEARVTTNIPATAPDAPTAIEITENFDNAGATKIEWSAPVNNGAAITGYQIQRALGATGDFFDLGITTNTNARSNIYIDSQVTAGAEYRYKIAAINRAGTGDYSAEVTVRAAFFLPEAPTGLSGISTADTITLSWVAPANNGGIAISHYEIERALGAMDAFAFLGSSANITYTDTGLTAGTEYRYRVFAFNSLGRSPRYTAEISVTTDSTAPDAPDAPMATSNADGTGVTLTWAAPANNGAAISGYVIQRAGADGDFATVTTPGSGTAIYTDSGLTAGTAYRYQIAALNRIGTGEYSTPVGITTNDSATATVPAASATPTASSNTAGSEVTLNWIAPLHNGGAAISGYIVRRAGTSGAFTPVSSVHSGTATTYTDTELTAGTQYRYQVAAVNSVGTGDYSTPVSITTNDPATATATVPAAPATPTASSNTAGTEATLNWIAPANGGAAITGYQIQRAAAANSAFVDVNPAHSGTEATYTDTELTVGTEYRYQIAAINSVGTGDYSAEARVTTNIPATAPDAPTVIEITENFDNAGATKIEWSAPVNNGAAITGYQIQRALGATGDFFDLGITTNTNARSNIYIDRQVTAGTEYRYKIAAINRAGTGDYSAEITVRAAFFVPDTPTGLSGISTADTITLSWVAPANNGGIAISRYTIERALGATDAFAFLGLSANTPYTDTGLTAGTEYRYRVAAINSLGKSPGFTAEIRVTTDSTAPGAPATPTATSNTAGTAVILTWAAPVNNGGAAISGYIIQRAGADGGFEEVTTTHRGTAIYTDSGLTAGTAYRYQIVALNRIGTGDYSTPVSITTNDPATATVPAAPATPTASSNTAGSEVILNWIAPLHNGGAAISGYIVQRAGTSGAFTPVSSVHSGTATTYIDTGLTVGSQYRYQVAAVNSAGTGDYSTPVSITTNDPATATVPAAPATPTASTTTTGSITTGSIIGSYQVEVILNWIAPLNNGGAAISGYVVRRAYVNQPNVFTPVSPAHTGTDTAYTDTDTGLSRGTVYRYQVAAVNSAGTGAYSTPVSITTNNPTGDTVPDAPATLTASSNTAGSEVSLNWIAPLNNGDTAISGYIVRRAGTNGAFTPVSSVHSGTATTYTDTGLTAGTQYRYQVAAVNSFGRGDYSTSISITTNDSAPSTPTASSNTAGTEVILNWIAPLNNGGVAISGYVVRRAGTTGAFTSVRPVHSGTATTYTDTGLTAGTQYRYQVAAVNSAGRVDYSTPVSITTNDPVTATVPAAPATPIASTNTAGTGVTLTWAAPADNGGAAISSYVVRRASTTGAFTPVSSVHSGTATTYTDSGLTAGTQYRYQVAAVNSAGTGEYSAETRVTTNTPATAPDAPTGLSGISTADTISLMWLAPANDGGAAIGRYVIERALGATGDFAFISAASNVTYTNIRLTPGTEYRYRVLARNLKGDSDYSAVISVTTTIVPAAPATLTASSNTAGTSVTLNWVAPANNSVAEITGYQIQRELGATGVFFNLAITTNTNTYTDSLVTAGTAYRYRVAAINRLGTGEYSAAVAVTTASTAPAAPAIPTASSNAAGTSVTLTWAAPATNGFAISGYIVQRAGTTGTFTPVSPAHSSTATTYTDTDSGLIRGTVYRYQIAAINNVGTSDYSTPVSITTNAPTGATVPAAPATPTASSNTAGSEVILNWIAPLNNGGAAISGYVVQRAEGASAAFIPVSPTHAGTMTTYSDSGLTPGTAYRYQVVALNRIGTGAYSAEASVTTTVTAPAAPATPTATSTDDGTEVTLTWAAPTDNGGAAISGYLVQRAEGASVAFTAVSPPHAGTMTTYTDSGLTPGTAYRYQVAAINSVGPGATAEASVTTTVTAPDAPTGLSGISTADTISLMWLAPANDGGAAISRYTIQRALGATGGFADIDNSANVTYIDTELTPGTEYRYRVLARNLKGNGDYSAVISVTTTIVPAAPATPTASSNTAGTSVTLNWVAPANNSAAEITGYQIQREFGATGVFFDLAITTNTNTYTDSRRIPGTTYRYRVAAINSAGTGEYATPVSITTHDPATVTVPAAPATPTASSNTAGTGVTLTWAVPANNGGAEISGYQIQRAAGANSAFVDVNPAHSGTGTTYTNTGLTAGTDYRYQIAAINSAGTGDYSAAASIRLNSPPTGTVTITGTATEGETLTAETGTIADADGPDTLTFSYQWLAGGTAIAAATEASFTLTQAQVGQIITVTVSYTDDGSTSESLTSAATAAVTNSNDAPTGTVTITGTATEGETLTAETGTIADADGPDTLTFSYQWLAGSTAIAAATEASFILTQAQVGQIITVTVSYTDGGSTSESLTSAATDTVQAVPNPEPVAEGSITTLTLTVGDATGERDVAGNFSDTDTLTYTAQSSATDIVTVATAASLVTVTPVAVGSATITVTATDTADQTATQTFLVNVIAETASDTSDSARPVAISTATQTEGDSEVITTFTVGKMVSAATIALANNPDSVTLPSGAASQSTVSLLAETVVDIQVNSEACTATAPCTVSLSYTDADLGTGGSSIAPSDLHVFHFTGGKWVGLASTLNAADKTVTASTSRFSPFGLGGVSAAALAEPAISASASTVTATAGVAITPVTITSTGGAVASYSIALALPNGLTLNTTTGTISGTPTAAASEVSYTITATNATGTATATVAVTVNAASGGGGGPTNTVPVADAGDPQTVAVGATVSLNGRGSSDPDSDTLSYAWSQTDTGEPRVTLHGASTATPSFIAPGGLSAAAVLEFSLTVRDSSLSSTDTVTITVIYVNAAPDAGAGPPQTVAEGATVSLDGRGSSDPDGDTLSYAWSQTDTDAARVSLRGANTATPSFTAPGGLSAAAVLEFSLTVRDDSLSSTDTVTITVIYVNAAPDADAGNPQTVAEGATVSLDGRGSSDPDGDTLSYAWSQTDTDAARVSLRDANTATPSFTAPTRLSAAAVLEFSLTVRDGSLSGTDTVTITVAHVNDTPAADAGAPQTVAEGATVTLSGSGTDPDGDDAALSYAWSQTDTGAARVSLRGANTATPSFTAPTLPGVAAVLTFTLTVTDAQGAAGTGRVQITVETDVAARQQALETTLAAFGRSVAAGAVAALSHRLKPASAEARTSTFGGSPLAACVASLAPAATTDATTTARAPGTTVTPWPNPNDNDNSLTHNRAGASCRLPTREQLARSTFLIPLNGLSETATADTDTDTGGWSLWGRGDLSRFEGHPQHELSLDGEVMAAYLGLDYRLESGGLVGLALSRSAGESDYRSGAAEGELNVDLDTVYPYGYWSPRAGLSLWGLLGIGHGDATLTHSATAFETDVDMRLGALGARRALHAVGGFELALKADAFMVELDSEALPGLPAVTAQASRARLMLEGRTTWQVQPDARLSTSVELGARADGGDADEGAGIEMGAGVEYGNTRLGLSAALQVQGLLAHQQSGFEEWGASLNIRLDPGVPGRGLALALAPVWGQAPSGGAAQALWESDRALQNAGLTQQQPSAQLDLDLSYGINGVTQLTPFAKLTLAEGIARHLRLGLRVERPDGLALEFFAGRNGSAYSSPELLLGLSGRLRF